MSIEFSAFDLRDAMTVCGGAIKPTKRLTGERPALKYVLLECHWNHCIAVGSNGAAIGMLRFDCKMSNERDPVKLHVLPIKIPAAVKTVVIDEEEMSTRITMIYKDGQRETIRQDKEDVNYFDYAKLEKSVIETIPDNKWVVVDPKLLLNCLNGLKDCESVIIHMNADPIKPILIKPYGESELDLDAEVIVSPVRP